MKSINQNQLKTCLLILTTATIFTGCYTRREVVVHERPRTVVVHDPVADGRVYRDGVVYERDGHLYRDSVYDNAPMHPRKLSEYHNHR